MSYRFALRINEILQEIASNFKLLFRLVVVAPVPVMNNQFCLVLNNVADNPFLLILIFTNY